MPRRRLILASALALGASGRPAATLAEDAGGDGDAAGRVTLVQGDAVLLRGDAGLPLAVGAAILRADTIRTGAGAKVRIECPDGLLIVVGPESEIRVSDYVRGRGLYSMELLLTALAGIVRLVGPPQAAPRRIDVLTRAALASVRSTDWLVDETAAGTGVFSREGRVEVTSLTGGAVLLEAGLGTDVAPGQPPTPPKRWGDPRRDRALARTAL